jgi:putative intracellular protease/amidase
MSRTRAALRRSLPTLTLVFAFLLLPLLVGGIGTARMVLAQGTVTPAPFSQPLPDRPAHDPSKRTAVVVVGNTGTESSDAFGPYETLAASGAFNVYVAAPERVLSPLFPSDLAIVPHYSFAEFDATFDAPDLVVVPYIPSTGGEDAAVPAWIRQQAEAGSTVLSICAGAMAVADAGVLDGRSSTSHQNVLRWAPWLHPEVNWVSGVRYVDDGQFISSAGVTSGVDATLYTIGRMLGRDAAEQTAQAIGYPHLRYLDDPSWDVGRIDPVPGLPSLYQAHRSEIGVVLYDGVRELEVSSIIDTYPRAFDTNVRTLAPERTLIHTRHGLDLVPASDFATAPTLDRLLVPGNGLTGAALANVETLAANRGLTVESVHAAGGYLYDATFRDLARHTSNGMATQVANMLEYPTRDLALDGPALRFDLLIRPLALGLLGLGVALWLKRRPAVVAGIGRGARFALHFGEMWIAMALGMVVFHLLAGMHGNGATSEGVSAAYEAAYQLGMMVFMTVPMVAWMRVRGHSWRHGAEMAVAMLAPVVAIQALLMLGAGASLPWLRGADGSAMMLGMLAAMLLRPGHYTGSAHRHHPEPVGALA